MSINEFLCPYTEAALRATTGESYFESETPILQRMMKSDQTREFKWRFLDTCWQQSLYGR